MNEQLIVKNFGPIKDATVDFKRVTVFIGPTGEGKSTLAKLAGVFRDEIPAHDTTEQELADATAELLTDYGIFNYYGKHSEIKWNSQLKKMSLSGSQVTSSHLLPSHLRKMLEEKIDEVSTQCKVRLRKGESIGSIDYLERIYQALPRGIDWEFQIFLSGIFPNPIYVPAERTFASSIEESLFKLNKIKVELPKTLEKFMTAFENARKETHFFDIPFLDVKYSYGNNENRLQLENKTIIKLKESASGVQSVLPLLLVVDYSLRNNLTNSFIIEEPELNLYPTAQYKLIKALVEKCANGENDLTITTHSPYILSSCNLLLEAYKVAQLRPDLEEEIAAIVPKACWLNPDEFAAYYVADGTVKPITDERTHLIGGNELDAVSGDISDSFRKLLRLKKQAV